MTLAGSVILVDQTAVPLATPDIVKELGASGQAQWVLTANLLPLAALMVVGGRIGDIFGLRKVFLIGAALFAVATAITALAPDIETLIAGRVVQGTGAALMMPNTVAIVSTIFPREKRGSALGVLAGGTAFFAALGPLMGGLLASADWRLIFVVNFALTILTVVLTLASTPKIAGGGRTRIDYGGLVLFAAGIALFVFGLGQIASQASDLQTFGPIAVGLLALAAFVFHELRTKEPLMKLRLLRNPDFAAANLSQMIAGAVELGLGFLLPFNLLLVVGVTPAAAGIALLPASIPIILAGPLAGRAYDRFGGRGPLVVGYLVLAASGLALAAGASDSSVLALIPGLVLQGTALGIILTVNDPVGLGAVPDDDAGQAAGVINTTEQLGGAIGIAAFLGLEYGHYIGQMQETLAKSGISPTADQYNEVRDYVMTVEQKGESNVPKSDLVQQVVGILHDAHIAGFQLAYIGSAIVALVGAVLCGVLVRPQARLDLPVRSRRMRWVIAGMRSGRTN